MMFIFVFSSSLSERQARQSPSLSSVNTTDSLTLVKETRKGYCINDRYLSKKR